VLGCRLVFLGGQVGFFGGEAVGAVAMERKWLTAALRQRGFWGCCGEFWVRSSWFLVKGK